MSAIVTHTFVSAIADDPASATAGEILPQAHWNAAHTIVAAGSDTQVQLNVSGDIGSSANLVFSSPTLRVGVVSSVTGQIALANSASAFLTTLKAGNAAAARTYTWPTNFGSAGDVLTDAAGDGTLSWAAGSGSSGITIGTTGITSGTASRLLYETAGNKVGEITGATSNGTVLTLVAPILGTPASGTLTNCTLPVGGVTGLGTGVATFLATPSSANLAAALTDETGSGAAVFATSPTFVTPILGTPTSGTLTNCTLPVGGITGLGTGVGTALAVNVGSAGAPVVLNGAGGTPSSLTGTNITGTATGLTSGITNALKSATTTVDVSAATAPTSGQVLTATAGTTATWQTPSGGSGITIGSTAITSGASTRLLFESATNKVSESALLTFDPSTGTFEADTSAGNGIQLNNAGAPGLIGFMASASRSCYIYGQSNGTIEISGGTNQNVILTANAAGGEIWLRSVGGIGLTITDGGTAKLKSFTVSGLPSASGSGAGATAFVTDASTTLILGLGTTVVGGGSGKVPVYSDGTNWLYG